jgi:hypothetical protein
MNVNVAVPELVNWLVPKTWMSVQYVAAPSQKLTCPVVTAVAPAVTVAVRVTAPPDGTVVTTLLPEVITSAVPVDEAKPRSEPPQKKAIERLAVINNCRSFLAFKVNICLLVGIRSGE